MKHVTLPTDAVRRLPFFLAMEEWVATHLPPDIYVFTWVVGPTVICGRNQDIQKEVNLEFCRANNIDVVRRRSGGGCVFANHGNIMVSMITPDTNVERAFAFFTSTMAAQLQKLGIPASVSGRNDITVHGRKISGTAFLHLPGRSIVHATMLFDTDTAMMHNAITPSRAKLESKRVVSVESRIITANRLLPQLSFREFHNALLDGLINGKRHLTPAETAEIEALEQVYYRPEWLWRKDHECNARSVRIEGVGDLSMAVALNSSGLISNIALSGDFFEPSDGLAALLEELRGIPPEQKALANALRGKDMRRFICGLSTDNFINLITNNSQKDNG